MENNNTTKLKKYLKTVFVIVLIAITGLLILPYRNKLSAAAVRGEKFDLWADKVFGKRDFGENSPRKVVPYKLHTPGGVIVDRSVSPGRAYVWDAGNSRIVGVDLSTCYATEITESCIADIIIGQPSGTDYGACNQDASFSDYPNRKPASATSLCGIGEWTHTTLEDKSFTSMATDSDGNLYVADSLNHRVLKFISPFTTDTVADQVWGQTDFTGNSCNKTGGYLQAAPSPDNSSLCFSSIGGSGSGVTIDLTGNLWVADGGNNRVLRFSKSGGNISQNADLVLGQPNFTTGGDYSYGDSLNQFASPSSIGVDSLGNIYVADQGNNRILKFTPPFTNGMSGTVVMDGADFHDNLLAIQMTPDGNGFFTSELSFSTNFFNKRDLNGNAIVQEFSYWNPGGGSIGIDTNGSVLTSSYVYGNGIIKHDFDIDTNTFVIERDLFPTPWGYNATSADRLEQGGWAGMVVLSNGQLVVTDNRMLFWNNAINLSNGAAPDGYVGGSSAIDITPGFNILAADESDRIFVKNSDGEIEVFQGPLSLSSTPIQTIAGTLNLAGGGTIAFPNFNGMAVNSDSTHLWLTDGFNNRAIRIRNPLTSPLVDIVIGQEDIMGNECNRGLTFPTTAPIDTLCNPGAVKLDKYNNLYISDHFFELSGNYRILMFSAEILPASPSTVLFDLSATKEFPWDLYSFASFEPAFDSTNRMVIGFNPYSQQRFLRYFNNPTSYNSSNPSDSQFAIHNGSLNDFYGWPFALTFDSNDNLFVYDTNRGKIMVYFQPFIEPPVISLITPVPSLTVDTTPPFTFNSNKAGTITFGGVCSSSSSTAVLGNNTISLNTLSPGTYSGCTLFLTDDHSNQSNTININTFKVTTVAAQRKLKGDFNNDGYVNLQDLSILAAFWNQNVTNADANGDNKVNISDLSIVAQNWLQNV